MLQQANKMELLPRPPNIVTLEIKYLFEGPYLSNIFVGWWGIFQVKNVQILYTQGIHPFMAY